MADGVVAVNVALGCVRECGFHLLLIVDVNAIKVRGANLRFVGGFPAFLGVVVGNRDGMNQGRAVVRAEGIVACGIGHVS